MLTLIHGLMKIATILAREYINLNELTMLTMSPESHRYILRVNLTIAAIIFRPSFYLWVKINLIMQEYL